MRLPWFSRNKNFSAETKDVSKIYADKTVCLYELGTDLQTVLLSDPINDKALAEFVADFIVKEYGVTTKVEEAIMAPGYQIWVYRIDLDLIDKYYNEDRKGYLFLVSDMKHDATGAD